MQGKQAINTQDLLLTRGVAYEAMIRNGWYLPAIKSPFVTLKYLSGVKRGPIYCPKFSDIRLRPCPTPPSKEELVNALVEYEQRSNKKFAEGGLARSVGKGPFPDKKWMLDVLSTVNPALRIFDKDYQPPR